MQNRREILIVEDSPTQAARLHYMLEKNGFSVRAAANGREALGKIREQIPEIVISDIVMPQMTGYELCSAVKADDRLKAVHVLLVSSLSDPKDVIRGLEAGADGFIVKPYEEEALIARVRSILAFVEAGGNGTDPERMEVSFDGERYLIRSERRQILNFLLSTYETAVQKNTELRGAKEQLSQLNLELERKVEERTSSLHQEIAERQKTEADLLQSYEQMKKTLNGIVKALSTTVEKRDPYTAGHELRVAQLSRAIADQMGMAEERMEYIHIASILHDIGKIAVPIEILSKPGMINDPEFSIIKYHPQSGHEILQQIDFSGPVAEIVLQHHERYDGSGYPRGLAGDEILVEARIIAVADTVEAMSSHRPYRPARGLDKAILEIMRFRGTHYDPAVVDACIRVFADRGFEFHDEK